MTKFLDMKKIGSAFDGLKTGHSIFVHTGSCNPELLMDALIDVVKNRRLTGIKIYHLHLEGRAPHVDPTLKDQIETKCFFVGSNCRAAVSEGRASYVPVFLSEIPSLFLQGIVKPDFALLQVSPIDRHGFVTLGPSVDVSLTAMRCSETVVALVNRQMPRVLGDGIVSMNEIDFAIEVDRELPESICLPPTEVATQIGKNVASLIDDGSTLQTGIGEIPNAVLSNLNNHKDLGVHTEMFSDGLLPLILNGNVTNRQKKIHPFKVVSSFAMGSRALYDFLNDNALMQFMSSGFVNDPGVILKNPKVCAINSALEIDLTGQVCADSIGHRIYSGVGGQVDFLRGAALSPGGKAIIAMPSQTGSKNPKRPAQSKIVSTLKAGAGVVSTRAHVQYVVTEFGVADLRGKTIHERMKAMIAIAHPDHRDQLEQESRLF